MTGDRPTTPGWHCHRCRSTSCRQRADSDTDHVGRVEYRPLLLTQPSSVSWLWSHTHWCPSQRPQEVTRVDGSANPTMPKNPTLYSGLAARLSWCGEFISRLRWLAKVFLLDGAGSADWGGRGCACFVEKQKRTSSGFCRVSSVRAGRAPRGEGEGEALRACGES